MVRGVCTSLAYQPGRGEPSSRNHREGVKTLTIPQALRISRIYREMSQADVDVPLSQQMKSAIERGQRLVPTDIAPVLAAQLDHPALYAEMARELTGFGPAWLDGPNVDLHRAAVREKCMEELREAMQAMDKHAGYLLPDAMTDRQQKERYEHLLQAMDGLVALYTYIGTQCLEYGYSMAQVSRDHYAKLRGRRYVQG